MAFRLRPVPCQAHFDAETRSGFLRFTGVFTRTGVFQYKNRDGTIRRELRIPEHIFADSHLDSLRMLPITDSHPDGFLTPDNAGDLQGGHVGERLGRKPHEDVDLLVGSGMLTDGGLIEKAREGKDQLSLGYFVNVRYEAGEHPVFGEYDAIQTELEGNHLAVVDQARAGDIASMHFDSDHARMDGDVAMEMRQDDADVWRWPGANFDDAEVLDDQPPVGLPEPHEDGSTLGGLLRSATRSFGQSAASGERTAADLRRQMADQADTPISTINSDFAGQTQCPPLERLVVYADVLDLDAQRLIGAGAVDGCEYELDDDTDTDTPLLNFDGDRPMGQNNDDETPDNRAQLTVDGATFDVPESVADAYSQMKAKLDQQADTIESLEADVDVLEQKLEDAQAEGDEQTEGRDDGAGAFQERVRTLCVAHEVGVEAAADPLNCDASTADLKRQVVGQHLDKDLSDKGEVYIDGAYGSIESDKMAAMDGDAGKYLAQTFADKGSGDTKNTDDTDNPFTPTGHTDNDSDAGDGDGDGGDNVKQLNDSIAEQYTAVE